MDGHSWVDTDEYSEEYDWLQVCMCSTCGLKCDHSGGTTKDGNYTYQDDDSCACNEICSTCGLIVEEYSFLEYHIYNDDRICVNCGTECGHFYTTIKCNPSTEGCVESCDMCGLIFSTNIEHIWNNGICDFCGYECQHESYSDGSCNSCGVAHDDHQYNSTGLCTGCGYQCLHDGDIVGAGDPDDPELCMCAECGFLI